VPAGTPLGSELEQVRGIAQQALDRIRHRSQWLHPGVLDDFGLSRALEGAVEQFQRQTGIRTHLAAAGPLDSVREDCAIHVYRIVQEALSNAARHSGSPEAWVRIDCRGGDLQLDVEDHGSGIPAAPPAGDAPRGMGMVSMRERAELIGGELHVSPAPGGGTIVQLRVRGCLAPAASEVA
jgi:two-component system sensor histidine kinase UhpB